MKKLNFHPFHKEKCNRPFWSLAFDALSHSVVYLQYSVGCGSPVVKVSDHGRHVMSSSPVPLKTRRVGQRCTLNLSRAQTFSRWCGVEFHAEIVVVAIGGVAIYLPFGEFRRAKSYCHLYGVQGQRHAYSLPLATMNFVGLDLTTSDSAVIAGYSSGTRFLEGPSGDSSFLPESLQLRILNYRPVETRTRESHRNRRDSNEIDPISRIKDLLRQARTENGDIDLNALLSENVNDPVPLESFNISSSGFISDIFGRFTELHLHGLKAFAVDRLAINLAEMNLSAEMSVPMLSIVGDYFLQGSVTFFPLSGEGPFYMNLSSIVLKGHSIIKNSPNGKLTMENVNLNSDVGNIDLHFENLMGGGTWGSISNSLLNQLSELILGELKPTLLRELGSYLKYAFDELIFDQMPSGFMDPASTNLVDSILEKSANYLRENDMEPLPLPDYKQVYERSLFLVTTRGELDVFNGTLHGLSTLSRKGDVITVFANNSLIFEADFEFKNLTGNYQWLAEALGAEKGGALEVQVKSVEGFIRIRQDLKVGSRLELDSFKINGIRHVWLDLQGLGNWDYFMESIVNLMTNGMKLQLADAMVVPLEKSIQEQLDQINLIMAD
ncbi:uncharacterized protein TNCV_1243821 [Trichonephila clavipes]|nr:uncharacterized protein TNCV_1243821 [Trichonephila clavipes]